MRAYGHASRNYQTTFDTIGEGVCRLDREARCRESILLPRDGRWFEVTVDSILDAAGNLTGALHIITNITARKQTEARLTEQLAELRRWQDATLGREMRLLDLKREINELLIQAGRPRCHATEDPDPSTEVPHA